MELHNTLPFSSPDFFVYMLVAIGIMALSKIITALKQKYAWVIAFISAAYIGFLYPKPLQIIGLLAYLYIALIALRKWYKKDNILFPMLVLALPIFLMKSFLLVPAESASKSTLAIKNAVQIAGLSYMVFRVMGMYIDERRNTAHISVLSFFNFAAFLPTLLIGPIDRYKRFEGDIQKGFENFGSKYFAKGWNNFILGLLFKFILAEAVYRLFLKQLDPDMGMLYHVEYMYGYLFYLFFDFAGYSLLAIAFGNFLGMDVPINFDKPFLAKNPKEFWKRWHKSLGDWLGDYFFKPIFKYLTSKKIYTSVRRQNLSLFATFTLMGFWNGFELHFILSGMLFGFYSVVHNTYVYRCKKNKRDVFFGNLPAKAVENLSIFILFNLVAFAIYIFSGNLF